MPLYPLGISRRRDVPSVPKQAAGAIDMRWSLAGELACAFIDAPHQAVPPMLHAAALDAIHRRICVLPVRFGVALRDEAEIHSLLQDRRHELLDHLSRLDWTCEMGLRIAPPTTADQRAAAPWRCPPPRTQAASSKPQSPLAYMEERRSHYQRADEDADARPFDCAAIRGATARLLSAVAEAAVLPIASDPAGIPRRTRSRDGLSEPRGEHLQHGSGRAMRGFRTVAAVQLCVGCRRAFPPEYRWTGAHPAGADAQEQQPHLALLERGGNPLRDERIARLEHAIHVLSLFLGRCALARLLRKVLLLHLVLFHEQLRVFRTHENSALVQQSENQLVVAAACLGKLTDDSLLESADGQPILINPRFLSVEVQGIEIRFRCRSTTLGQSSSRWLQLVLPQTFA